MTVFARINFAKDAAAAGLTLQPTQLLILGSPVAGTPLMVAAPGTALDLPLKVLAWQDVGKPLLGLIQHPGIFAAAARFSRGTGRQYCRLGKARAGGYCIRSSARKVAARVVQDLRIGGMIGGFDRHDGFAQLRILVAKIAGELLLGLRRTDQREFHGRR